MESISHLKSLQPAHFFTFANHWALTPRPCSRKTKDQSFNRLQLTWLTDLQVFASNLHAVTFPFPFTEGFLGFLPLARLPVRKTSQIVMCVPSVPPLASRWSAIAASPPALSNRTLPAAVVQGQLFGGSRMATAGWHTSWSRGRLPSLGDRKQWWGEGRPFPLLNSLAVKTHVTLSSIVLSIQLSKNGFVTLHIHQMRSMSAFQQRRHLIALWASQHTNVMHDWLLDF